MGEYRRIMKRLARDLRPLFFFEVISKLLAIASAVPLFMGFAFLTTYLTGYSYLTGENITRFLSHPLVLAAGLLVIFAALLYILADLSAVFYALHFVYYGEKPDIFRMASFSLARVWEVVKKRENWSLFLILLVSLPVFGAVVLPVPLSNLLVQEMFLRRLRRSRFALILLGMAAITLLVLFLRLMYTCQIQALEGCKSKEAARKSALLGKGHHLHDFLMLLLTELAAFGGYALLLGLSMLAAVSLERLIKGGSFVNPISTSLLLTITTVSLILLMAWSLPAGAVCTGVLYYRHKQGAGEEIPSLEAVRGRGSGKNLGVLLDRHEGIRKGLAYLVLAGSLAACCIYVFLVYKGRFNPHIEYLHQTEVTAHRGASRYYPENTMAAFAGAVDQDADWVELDIHQSKDGELFVMHDASLKRTTGKQAQVWSLTWDEISRLDAGKSFSKSFSGEPIPLLADVIDFAGENHLRLNIELKPSPYEPDMEERLVELLQEKDFISECVVTSQKYSALEKVKELDPSITTVYVMSYAYGNILRLECADAFSVNISSISRSLVNRVHNSGRQIYAWTVNRRNNIEDMIDKNVDNIITDDVKLAKRIVGEKRTNGALYEYIRWLRALFR